MLALVRIVLLVLLATVFVATLVAVFTTGTGPVEKVVLVAVALLVMAAVPRVQRLRSRPGS
jgi:hypothetical protein